MLPSHVPMLAGFSLKPTRSSRSIRSSPGKVCCLAICRCWLGSARNLPEAEGQSETSTSIRFLHSSLVWSFDIRYEIHKWFRQWSSSLLTLIYLMILLLMMIAGRRLTIFGFDVLITSITLNVTVAQDNWTSAPNSNGIYWVLHSITTDSFNVTFARDDDRVNAHNSCSWHWDVIDLDEWK